jgi:Cu/Ag efflux protein CusF
MKTAIIPLSMSVCVILALTGRIYADDTATAKQKSFKGTVMTVDEKERTLGVKRLWSTRTFEIGDHCKVSLEDKADAALKDLRPGHRVEVQYLAHDGVKVACQIAQKDVTYTGHVCARDTTHGTFTVKAGTGSKTFVAGDDCKFVIREEKDKSLADLKIGHKVTVRYLTTPQANMARRVEQMSRMFTGTIDVIDAETRTLKAQHLFAEKKFKLANDCQIIVAGRMDGKLSDLRIGDKLSFHYEDVDGVLVANRVAREGSIARMERREVTSVNGIAQ